MIKLTVPIQDTTIYEEDARRFQNTGLDQVLDISKKIVNTSTFTTRVLMKFDIASLSESLSRLDAQNVKHYLQLKTANAAALPASFNIAVHPLSGSWENGTGRKFDIAATTTGSSWIYRDSLTVWQTGSFSSNVTASWSSNPGGGVWYETPSASTALNVGSTDLKVDITDIYEQWISGSIPNDGLIIKLADDIEQNLVPLQNLQYFSRDSNTVHIPLLISEWDDSQHELTSSTLPTSDVIIYTPKLRKSYKEDIVTKITVQSRPHFPVRVFSTSSYYTLPYTLPTSSYYQIRDAFTEEILVETGSGTKLSNDGTSSYFNFNTSGMMPERHYRFVFKVEFDSGEVEFYDDSYYFKISR